MDTARNFQMGHVKCSAHTIEDLLQEIDRLLTDRSLRPRSINCLNAHIYSLSYTDAELRDWLNASRVVPADGMGVVWAARLFGQRLTQRCNMTESFRAFLRDERFPESRGILIGCTPEQAEAAARRINSDSRHVKIVAHYSGYLRDDEYRAILTGADRVDFILVGMGTPRSERMVALAGELRPEAVCWHIGGGTMLIYAGATVEAPAWMRRSGLQWLHRLALEPRHKYSRIFPGFLIFYWRAFRASRQTRGSGAAAQSGSAKEPRS